MNRQFYHGTQNKGHNTEFTLAMEVPTKENLRIDIWKLLGDNIKTVKYSMGVSQLSPKDRYNRKTGRELTSSRMQEVELYLASVTVVQDATRVTLVNWGVAVVLEMKQGRDKVHLIEVEV